MTDEMRDRVKAFLVERDEAHGFAADFVGDQQRAEDADAILALIASELERVERERDELSRALTGLTRSGSEFFKRSGDGFIADVDACVSYIKDARSRSYRRLRDALVRAQAAEARATAAEARLAEAVEVIREVEPFIVFIVCYASSIDEYEPNRIAKRLHAFMEQQG